MCVLAGMKKKNQICQLAGIHKLDQTFKHGSLGTPFSEVYEICRNVVLILQVP